MGVRSTVLVSLFCLCTGLLANDAVDRAQKYEDTGDSAAAKEVYTKALQATPNDADLVTGYAQFLERYRDPGARDQWRKSAGLWKALGRTQDAAHAARQAVKLDLIAGDRAAADTDAKTGDLRLPEPSGAPAQNRVQIAIPGPIKAFARMAALPVDISPDAVLTAVARNVVTNGYQASRSNEVLEETEYLKLVQRYLSQARELDALAGPDKFIRIEMCESTKTNDLLRVLGYRMRGGCGSEVVLETVNAARAFITTDSGFPLAELEQALRTDRPFSYDYHPSHATVLFSLEYWQNSAKTRSPGEFIDTFLLDPGLCRLYLGMAKLDPETAEALRAGIAAQRLRALANVLDFFGGNFELRQGKAIVPGGAKSAAAWADLAGASPDKGAEFFDKLMSKDDGWLASMYDSLARISGPMEDYLTDPARLKRFYLAVRGRVTSPGPARPVFRSNTEMMLLTTRLHLDPGGRVHVPGDLDVWKALFEKNPRGKYDAKLSKAAVNWKDGDDIVEALFALCRKPVDNQPLKIFLALSDIDRNRSQPLKPETVQRLVRSWTVYGQQYPIFNDASQIGDSTILAWMDAAEAAGRIRDSAFRQDTVGTFEALTGLWEIFVRQGSIPADQADTALTSILMPFGAMKNAGELFDAGRSGINTLLKIAAGEPAKGVSPQDRMLELLAGGPHIDDSESRGELVRDEQRIFEAQKLLPVDLLFELADNLQGVAKGEKLNARLAQRLASRVGDIDLPRSSMSGVEKNSIAFGYWVDRHIDDERKLNLRAVIDKAAKDPEKLKDIRGQLAPALRDTLVGYNYIYYAPPGAQILITNPLFVRGHDFQGTAESNHAWRTTEVYGTGWPSNAGGRLVGSLIGLPYALASAEENFLVPTHTQALIWGDLVPQMMLTARAPRFWSATRAEMHWVGLHMRFAEDLMADAALDPAHRAEVSRMLYQVASPLRASQVIGAIESADVHDAIEELTPAEMYRIADGLAHSGSFSGDTEAAGIARLQSSVPDQVSEASISRTWGTPKPTLANSYRQELLNLRTFPTLMGYSSRIMAESWESNLLYWADLGDQMGVQPAQLNVLVPDWTRQVVERIFATSLEDWPALLKSVRSVGDDLRAHGRLQSSSIAERAGN